MLRAISPFPHSVFKRLVSQGRQKVSLCGNGLKEHEKHGIWHFVGRLHLQHINRTEKKYGMYTCNGMYTCTSMYIFCSFLPKKSQF